MSQLLEVNEYAYVQTLGVRELTQVGAVQIVPSNVVKMHWETQVPFGPGTQDLFRVHMVGGRTFITDEVGTGDIAQWNAPFENNFAPAIPA
jgi:hypothetical protein